MTARTRTKPRNPNPFTERRIRFITAVTARLNEIDNPTAVLTTDRYTWTVKSVDKFGKLPKLSFEPDATRIKAEIMRAAGLTESISKTRKDEIAEIRENKLLPMIRIRSDNSTLADNFEKEWDETMFAFKRAVFLSGYLNRCFAANTTQPLSEPAKMMQGIVREEYAAVIGKEKLK